MRQTERYYRIDQLIRARGVIDFKSLQQALEVSRATLVRDLAALRDRFNAPIVFERERGGYVLADAGFGPQYELPGLWFNDREILALLLERYVERGILQFSTLSELMKVQPFARYGSPAEIATRHFGGVRGMKDAVSRLQSALYQ